MMLAKKLTKNGVQVSRVFSGIAAAFFSKYAVHTVRVYVETFKCKIFRNASPKIYLNFNNSYLNRDTMENL